MSVREFTKEDFHNKITENLKDTQLKQNLKGGMDTLKANRKKLIEQRYYDWEGLRELGSKIKRNVLANLPDVLERFEKNATKNGIKVHWAKGAKEANQIIYDLAISKNITTILKGKSMASEEIHFNQFMKEKGLNAVETDLGELIIQLIDEPPVHIVVPAIHKNKNQIGKIFEEKLGSEFTSVPEELNRIARTHMRNEFKEFKMGLTGCNFAIANEGAIWLLENEGNGRMSSTACDVHVAICGIEKMVESFDDACVLDTLLVPSATGAAITCYNNIITSPRKMGVKLGSETFDELDGPREVHVILLDNNRSNMLKQKHYSEALSCIRCGTCLNHCPVYDKIGGHAYLSTYPGPIGEVISPQLFGLNSCAPITNLCTLCGRCTEKCPVKIPLAELIRDLRSEKAGQGHKIIKGYSQTKRDKSEQNAMKQFSKVATSGFKWRMGLKAYSITNGLVKWFANSSLSKNTMLGAWMINHEFPKFNGDLHSMVKKLKDVVYE